MRLPSKQFHRFLWTGAFNTVNGYIWIFGIQLLTGSPVLANLLGYSIAGSIGYVTHSRFTFRQNLRWQSAGMYAVIISGSYLVNLLILVIFMRFTSPLVSQFIAITTFVFLSYLGQSRLTFSTSRGRSKGKDRESDQSAKEA
ncbi:MAG: GtrA family protein [Prochlorococcaceae cyanobacterium]|jgi:putative flippase GtrA